MPIPGARRSMGIALPGARAAAVAFIRGPGTPPFPQPDVAVDLDFIGRRYYWNGALRKESEFTTFALNGGTLDINGLTPSATTDITIATASLGAVIPGAYASQTISTSAPAGTCIAFEFDDGTANNRILTGALASTGNMLFQAWAAAASQASLFFSTLTQSLGKHGCAASYDTNSFLVAGDGLAGTSDLVGSLPAVTTLRVGKGNAAGTAFPGSIARIWLFSAPKTQAEITSLSAQIRDAPAPTVPQAETLALTSAMTVQPTVARRNVIDNLIAALKSAGLWTTFDFFHVLAAHDEQAGRINWVNPAQVLTTNGTVTFTADRGHKGDGATGYLGYGVLHNALVKHVQNNCSEGIWCQNEANNANPLLGLVTGLQISVTPRVSAGNAQVRLMNVTPGAIAVPLAAGHLVGTRAVSTGFDIYKNGALVTNIVSTSGIPGTAEVTLLRSAGNFNGVQLCAAAHLGSALDATQNANLYSALSTYMAAVGAA